MSSNIEQNLCGYSFYKIEMGMFSLIDCIIISTNISLTPD